MHNYITDSFFFEPGLKVRSSIYYKYLLLFSIIVVHFTLDQNLINNQRMRSLPTGEIILPKRRKRIIMYYYCTVTR